MNGGALFLSFDLRQLRNPDTCYAGHDAYAGNQLGRENAARIASFLVYHSALTKFDVEGMIQRGLMLCVHTYTFMRIIFFKNRQSY